MSSLLQLRNEIDKIDKSLLVLLAKRMQLVTTIGKLKNKNGMPIYSLERESSILKARCKEAEKMGIRSNFVNDVLSRIISESYQYENDCGFKQLNSKLGPIFIIGGQDQIGKLFSRLFKLSGYKVCILKTEDLEIAHKLLTEAAVIIINVSTIETVKVIHKLPKLSKDTLLINISIIKEQPLKAMLSVHDGPVVSLNPILNFGINSFVKQVVIYCDGRNSQAYQWLLEQLIIWGARLYKIDAIEHDRYMWFIYTLRYFIAFIYGEYLSQKCINLKKLLILSSSVYRLDLAIVKYLFAQDPEFYANIIMMSDEYIDLIVKFYQNFDYFITLIKRCDKGKFISKFKKVNKWFSQNKVKRLMQESNDFLYQLNNINI